MPDYKALKIEEKLDFMEIAAETPYYFWIRHSLLCSCPSQQMDSTFDAIDFAVGLEVIDGHYKLLSLFFILEIAFNLCVQIKLAI